MVYGIYCMVKMQLSQLTHQDKYNYLGDSGSNWLEVSRKELIDLGILNKISNNSHMYYQKTMDHLEDIDVIYLERDSDMQIFIEAKQKLDKNWRLINHFVNKIAYGGICSVRNCFHVKDTIASNRFN